MILGLTGSIGSGKSFVCSLLREHGAVIASADEIAREVTAPGTPALGEIVAQFGSQVLRDDGTLDRGQLAGIVFARPELRRSLEKIVHPRVRDREIEFLEQHRDAPLVVLEIPLLYEAGADDLCDAVAVVAVSEEVRHQRLARDRGMDAQEVARRLAAQLPQDEKIRRADFVIENSSSPEDTRRQVAALYAGLLDGTIRPKAR